MARNINNISNYTESLERMDGMLTRAFVHQDFDDPEPMLSLYTDDGRGNGNLILRIPVSRV